MHVQIKPNAELDILKRRIESWLKQKGYTPVFKYIDFDEEGELYIELEAKGLKDMEKAIKLSREVEKFLQNDDIVVAIYPQEG